jgi:hypothetical protein
LLAFRRNAKCHAGERAGPWMGHDHSEREVVSKSLNRQISRQSVKWMMLHMRVRGEKAISSNLPASFGFEM